MRRFFFLLVFSVIVLGLTAQAYAIQVYNQNDTKVSLGFKTKIWFQSIEDAAPNGHARSNDFSLRQGRFYLKGQYTKTIKFGANFDWNKLGTVDGKSNTTVTTAVTDAWVGFDFIPQLNFMTGKYRIAFSRYSLTPSYTAFLFPHHPFSANGKLLTESGDYRQLGVTAWGFFGKRFRYNVGVASGVPKALSGGNDSSDSLLYSARAEYTVLGLDKKGYLHGNEWVGKRGKLLTFGAGYLSKRYDMSPDTVTHNVTYSAWTADSYFEYPVGEGSIAAEAAYYDYDQDTPENPKIKAWYAQMGYLIPGRIGPGQLEPGFRYDSYKPDGDQTGTTAWSVGLNYYIKGNNAKVQIEYMNVNNDAHAKLFSGANGKDTDALTVQLILVI
jgi:Phosphate-selective porin O and P